MCCGRPIDNRSPYALCGHCVRILQWADGETCQKCGKPLLYKNNGELCNDCRQWGRKFKKGFTTVRYGRIERDIIHRFKYRDKSYFGAKLAELMYERICLEDIYFDMVLPVPMYKGKERRRGYNQADLLARVLARNLEMPYRSDILIRTTDTIPMSSLNVEERRDNFNGVFTVAENKEYILKDKTVLLVDDIFTTGSTVEACSVTLLDSGVDVVYVLTFAAGMDSKRTAV